MSLYVTLSSFGGNGELKRMLKRLKLVIGALLNESQPARKWKQSCSLKCKCGQKCSANEIGDPRGFDCNVIMAAAGWRSEPYRCLIAIARRQATAFVTDWILEEFRRTAAKMVDQRIFPADPRPTLAWFAAQCQKVEATPLGKQRSRDINDDPYLECALAARAEFIVSRDPRLLELEKPFGIAIVTPRQFLAELKE